MSVPSGYVAGPLLENFYVHTWTNIKYAGDSSLFVIIVGHCIPTQGNQTEKPVADLLAALRQGESYFLYSLGFYTGRHAIIFGSVGDVRVVNDATAMRTVFYAAEGGIIASHALLVERALGGRPAINQVPFQYGFPGNRTPYERTKVLTANTYYWLTANVVRRFWPFVQLEPYGVDAAAAETLQRSAFALRYISSNQPVRLTLTAGLDSRAILAIALHAGIEFQTYTYGDNTLTDIDRAVATELAEKFSLRHDVINQRFEDPALEKRLREVNYMDHHMPWVGSLMDYYPSPESVAVLGNSLEIGRSNTLSARRYRNLVPNSAESMANLHYRRVGVGKREAIKAFGHERYMEISRQAFQAFIYETSFDLVTTSMNPFDLFYWEHRMSAWQSLAMNERDFYGHSFVPFNSRSIFETMLGVSEKERYADATVYRMIEMVDPELLDLPINPKQWPQIDAPARAESVVGYA